MAKRRRTQVGIHRLERQVLHLREQSIPFSKIAKDLGISKAYAVKLSGGHEGRSPAVTTDPSGHSKLTVRERRFAKGLVEGKSQRQAALDAVEPGQVTPHAADAWANRTMKNHSFASEFQKMLASEGLTELDIARIHSENLRATKVVGWHEDEDGNQVPITHPDYATRQRAVDKGWELYGRGKYDNGDGSEHGTKILVVTEAVLRQIEAMRGGPIDPNLIEIQGEPIEDDPDDEEVIAPADQAVESHHGS